MALRGRATLCIWNTIDAAFRAEFETYHSAEHMPERMLTPGVISARRYVEDGRPASYFTLYEIETEDVLSSDAYLSTADSPTAWTAKMQMQFGDFCRMTCATVFTRGLGVGGLVVTLRVALHDTGDENLRRKFNARCRTIHDEVARDIRLIGFHVCDSIEVGRATLIPNSVHLKKGGEHWDAVLLLEFIDAGDAATGVDRIVDALRSEPDYARRHEVNSFNLAHLLTTKIF